LAYYDTNKIDVDSPDSLLDALAAVFHSMSKSSDRLGVLSPKAYVKRLKIDNELFRGYEHQDAQEFLNFLLNSSSEQLGKLNKAKGLAPSTSFIQDIFEGTLVNETKCICCETVTTRTETFLDLSLDIQSDCTIRDCLRSFSSREMLNKGDKYFCDRCQVRQEAFKWYCFEFSFFSPMLCLLISLTIQLAHSKAAAGVGVTTQALQVHGERSAIGQTFVRGQVPRRAQDPRVGLSRGQVVRAVRGGGSHWQQYATRALRRHDQIK
jgi:hypothetical protein